MIHKMTGQAAERTLIDTKGIIADGMDADLVLFNYDTVRDAADFLNPNALSDGIEYVIVAGEVVYHDKKLTGATPGKVVLHRSAIY
jgi:N-acyl-D-amino-acid deacylase